MASAKQFLHLLKERDLLPPELLQKWEREIERAAKPISAELVAKRLIELGYLTKPMAERLLKVAAERKPTTAPKEPSVQVSKQDEELVELVPIEEVEPSEPEQQPSDEAEELVELVPLEDEKPKAPSAPPKTAETPSLPRKPSEQATPPKPRQPHAKRPAPASAAKQPTGAILTPSEPSATAPDVAMDLPLEGLPELAQTSVPIPPTADRETTRRVAPRKRRRNVWESALILVGGGGLVFLAILAAILLWAVKRQGADELLKLAEEDYHSGSYTQAIAKFNDFLERYPDHPAASMVRVHRGLAKLRQATDSTSNWSEALQTAKDVLEEIASEEAFRDEARGELLALLPKIAEGLAQQAHERLDASLVGQAEEALALIEKYIPANDRPIGRINDIESLLTVTTRKIEAGKALQEAISKITTLAQAGKANEAYKAQQELLAAYPELSDDADLRLAVQKIAAAELKAVRVVSQQLQGQQENVSQHDEGTLLVERHITRPASSFDDRHTVVIYEGNAYGIRLTDGTVLWYRHIGRSARIEGPPPTAVAVPGTSDAQFLVVDHDRQELLCLSAETGKAHWRLGFDEEILDPVVLGYQALVATATGKLHIVNAHEGTSDKRIEFPQPIPVPPAIDPKTKLAFQPVDHATLFVISLQEGTPVAAVYVGHPPGTVAISPIVLQDYLLVPINTGAASATIYVIKVNPSQEQTLWPIVQTIPIEGHLDTPASVYGRRAAFVSSSGRVYIVELQAADPKKPINIVARATLPAHKYEHFKAPSIAHKFAVLAGSKLWVAHTELALYEIIASRGILEPRHTLHERTIPLQAPLLSNEEVVYISRPHNAPGVNIVATDFGRSERWRTSIACPLAGGPFWDADSKEIWAITSGGALFKLAPSDIKPGEVIDTPAIPAPTVRSAPPFDICLKLYDDRILFGNLGEPMVRILDPNSGRMSNQLLPGVHMGSTAFAWRKGVVVSDKPARIAYVDFSAPRPNRHIFQFALRVEADNQIDLILPVPETTQLVAVTSGKTVTLLSYDEPARGFRVVRSVQSDLLNVEKGAITGNSLFLVDEGGQVSVLALPELKLIESTSLGAACQWGPFAADAYVVLATEDERLICLDEKGKRLWEAPCRFGMPVGHPGVGKDQLYLAWPSGTVAALNIQDGKIIWQYEVHDVLASGPILLDEGRLLVAGKNAALYLVEEPQN